MVRVFLLLVLLVVPAPALLAQASLHCAMRPASLKAMLHCFRPLLVFSPSPTDARLKKQSRILNAAADDMMDRFVMLTPVVPEAEEYATPLDTPYMVLKQATMRKIRERFRIPRNRFEVLLLDEDGRVRLRSTRPVDITRLNALIDSWPERKIEMTRRDAN
ncbi:MAG: DUF4174 domain-containing protein [Acidobacteriaceae bacterium]